MTLYDLANSTTVQGDIRVSKWIGDEEKVLLLKKRVEDFHCPLKLESKRVLYIFCPGDGYLHIEVE